MNSSQKLYIAICWGDFKVIQTRALTSLICYIYVIKKEGRSDREYHVADYSCAVQKDILLHGRLYVTQNYLCFYANIFGWETNIVLKWKNVTAITKEKTAIVIPNAVLISTKTEKFFFTSFVARDKVYLMLFRVWQNALMDKQMSQQEMWQWVRSVCFLSA